jgi:beta-catenin-like protein 1
MEPGPSSKRPRSDASELLAQAERELEASQVDVETLDANSLKRLILHVEKQINSNMALRMKYADQPERFLDSELELYQALKGLHAVAASPELYPVFVKTKCVPSLLGLLAHENADIANDALELLQEMASAEDATPEDLLVLVDALLEHGAAAMLADNLTRLNDADDDEAQAAHSTLSVFESILEARPEAADELAQRTPLLTWLLNRVKLRGFHAVKLYASELLALLLQQRPANQAFLGKTDGVLSLLTAAAQYKRREPADLEEAELIENVFNALCAALELADNQALFLRAEGIELMVLTLKENRYASRCALRALDAALASNGANCERFVDIRGFKTLFPLLGASPPPLPPFAKGRGEREAAQRAHDAHVASVLCTLFHQLGDERRQRLLGKFAEDELAKASRLLALRAAYDVRVAEAEAMAEAAAPADEEEEDDDEEEGDGAQPTAEERIYLARMDAGLPTLLKMDVILGYLATAKAKPLRVAVLHGLYEQGRSLHDVAANIDEDAKVVSGTAGRADPARDERLARMNEAVQALLLKYDKAAAPAAASTSAQDGDGAA